MKKLLGPCCEVGYIYRFTDPRKPTVIRYIGKTVDTNQRYKNHITESFIKNTRKGNWIRSLIFDRIIPEFVTTHCVDLKSLDSLETELIKTESKNNPKLLNLLDNTQQETKEYYNDYRKSLGITKKGNKWRIAISINKEQVFIGTLHSKKAAKKVYDNLIRYYNPTKPTNYVGVNKFSVEQAKKFCKKISDSLKNPYGLGIIFSERNKTYVVNLNKEYVCSHKTY